MKSAEIRKKFIEYFEKNGHTAVASSSLFPHGDDTLLFTNAGMNQFKNAFLGLEKRGYTRAVSSQKCVRAGGKHNDLDNVGFTARHHTFFEMLGNFSFGDYFKKEAIHFAWEFITKELKLPKDKLYVTVFKEDEEAAEIWHKQEGVPVDRIYKFGEKDNFWRMGDTGPCGPCTEIFYDYGPGVGCGKPTCAMGCDCDRYIEFWNLVFMQFHEDKDPSGKIVRTHLPKPSVDTGAGLERITSILQGHTNNYDTDLFTEIIAVAEKISGKKYVKDDPKKSASKEQAETNAAMRVLADHARSTSFLIADGVMPSNEGRGYVLRRIIRRGIRYGQKLNQEHSFLPRMAEAVIEKMSVQFPELKQQRTLILSTLKNEEERFMQTLHQGTQILHTALKELDHIKGKKILSGDVVFKLYDTFGFPADLTRLMAEEHGVKVDESEFETRMQKARETAKASWKGQGITADAAHLIQLSQLVKPTRFTGYELTQCEGKIVLLSNAKAQVKNLKIGEHGILITDQTCFYAEGGGQVGDKGKLKTPKGSAEVLDCTKNGEVFFHHVLVKSGEIFEGENVELEVYESSRRDTASNHSATHLLHAALRKILGDHVTQAGSLVDSDRLRFDYTHSQPLTEKEIAAIEKMVNEQIAAGTDVISKILPYKTAITEGAMALFGEKYGEEVRMLKMGSFSVELCGGTHVKNTSSIRLFKIVSDGGVSAGVRRMEAITGRLALDFLNLHTAENLASRKAIGTSVSYSKFLGIEKSSDAVDLMSVPHWIEAARNTQKDFEKQIRQLKGSSIDLDQLMSTAKSFEGGKIIMASLEVDDREVLNQLCDKLRDKIQSGVVVLVGRGEKSHPILVGVTKNLAGRIHAGNLLKAVAQEMGGSGGGRPDFAQGAAPDLTKVDLAFSKVIV